MYLTTIINLEVRLKNSYLIIKIEWKDSDQEADEPILIDSRIRMNRPAKIMTKGIKRSYTKDINATKLGHNLKNKENKPYYGKEISPLIVQSKTKAKNQLKRYNTLNKTTSWRNKLSSSESITEPEGLMFKMKTEKVLRPRRKRKRFKTNARSIRKRSSNKLKFETNLLHLNDTSLHPPAVSLLD